MSDFINIRVTERELVLIMDLLHEAGLRTDADGQPAIEICHDLMEQSGGAVDDLEPTEIDEGLFELSAEASMIQAGIAAREQAKESSRASHRRAKRFGEFDVSKPDRKLTKLQTHDLWERPNDPTKW
jgi:hypothetical protein